MNYRGDGVSEDCVLVTTGTCISEEKRAARFVLLRISMTSDEEIDALTEKIIGCGIEVHRTLGPGLLESVYRDCMLIELAEAALPVESERRVPINYKGRRINAGLKLDLLIDGCIVVELKSVEQNHPIHSAQVLTYLKLTGCPAGLLMNFNEATLLAGLKRLDHPDRFKRLRKNRIS